jgi:hypothetical protein
MEFAMRGRSTSAPLLPDSEHARSADQNDDEERDAHGKHTRWIILVPNLSKRQIVRAVLGVLALIIFIAGAIVSAIGVFKYRKLAFPHRAVHASLAHVKDGRNVIVPFFGRDGDAKRVRLVMTVWFREGTKVVEPDSAAEDAKRYWMQDSGEDQRWWYGGQGFVMPDPGPQLHQWEAVWTGDLQGMDSLERDARNVAKVTLPGRVV